VAGSAAAGLGMIGVAGWVAAALRSPRIEADTDDCLSPIVDDALAPQREERTVILFADRLRSERAAAAETDLLADIPCRRLH
jgi:hypothetical protein